MKFPDTGLMGPKEFQKTERRVTKARQWIQTHSPCPGGSTPSILPGHSVIPHHRHLITAHLHPNFHLHVQQGGEWMEPPYQQLCRPLPGFKEIPGRTEADAVPSQPKSVGPRPHPLYFAPHFTPN